MACIACLGRVERYNSCLCLDELTWGTVVNPKDSNHAIHRFESSYSRRFYAH